MGIPKMNMMALMNWRTDQGRRKGESKKSRSRRITKIDEHPGKVETGYKRRAVGIIDHRQRRVAENKEGKRFVPFVLTTIFSHGSNQEINTGLG